MFSGSIVAIITPMNNDGSIDNLSLKKLVNYHVCSGTSAITVMGTTGEAATLSRNEQWDVIKRVIDDAEGRIPVIAGIGTNSTSKAITLTQALESLGVAACLSVTPYYNKPSQEGLYQHYKTLAENTSLKHILYNVPNRTGCDLLPPTVAKLAQIPTIVGIKEATGDLRRVYALRRCVGDDFCLLSGDDATFLDFILLGGDGTISVTANIAAEQMARICDLVRKDISAARLENEALWDLHHALFIESNPSPVKWAATQLGLITSNQLRLPLVRLSNLVKSQLENALKTAKLM